jgi:hypothetical protein
MYKNLLDYENSNYFSPMKCYKGLLLLLFSISFAQLNAQSLKRKYRGTYTGQIPAYEVKMGTSTYGVGASSLIAFVDRDSVFLLIGSYRYAAPYKLEKSKETLTLTSIRENSGIVEQFLLDPKTKTIVRKGLYPQPDAILTRSGKLPRR